MLRLVLRDKNLCGWQVLNLHSRTTNFDFGEPFRQDASNCLNVIRSFKSAQYSASHCVLVPGYDLNDSLQVNVRGMVKGRRLSSRFRTCNIQQIIDYKGPQPWPRLVKINVYESKNNALTTESHRITTSQLVINHLSTQNEINIVGV